MHMHYLVAKLVSQKQQLHDVLDKLELIITKMSTQTSIIYCLKIAKYLQPTRWQHWNIFYFIVGQIKTSQKRYTLQTGMLDRAAMSCEFEAKLVLTSVHRGYVDENNRMIGGSYPRVGNNVCYTYQTWINTDNRRFLDKKNCLWWESHYFANHTVNH